MKKFAFSLQKLLDYQQQMFEIELTVLGDMRAVLAAMEEDLENTKAESVQRAVNFRQKAAKGMPAIQMETHKNYMTMLDFTIKQKEQQIQMQIATIERQAEKVLEAKREISTIEKLRERKLEEYNHSVRKAEELFIEEFVGAARVAKAAV